MILETARLRLRELTETDAEFILQLLNDPDFITHIADRGLRTAEDARRYIADVPATSYSRHGFGLWCVEIKESSVPIGICGLLCRDSHPDVELGYALLPFARGHGYALESGRASLNFGLESLGLKRIVAITGPANLASIRVLERLGFRFEGPAQFFGANGPLSALFVFDKKSWDTLSAP